MFGASVFPALRSDSGLVPRRNVFGVAAAGLFAPSVLRAQGAWPERPIRVIVRFLPGGSDDTIARLMQPKLQRMNEAVVSVSSTPEVRGRLEGTDADVMPAARSAAAGSSTTKPKGGAG